MTLTQEILAGRHDRHGSVEIGDHRPTMLSRDDRLRRLISEVSDQLCQVVDGNLDFTVRVTESDDDLDKLLLLVNFVLASARRSFSGLRKAHERLEEDLTAARNLQRKLLPQSLPRAKHLRVASEFVPASAVGGDFFDFLYYQRCGLHAGILADVSGKGVAAAIYAALTSGIIRSLLQEELSPQQTLERLNKNLYTRAPDGQFVAMTYSTWDDERLLLEICNSGLPEPLLVRNEIVYSLPIHGLPLGLFPEPKYEPTIVQCQPGDALLFYTDGIVEACDAGGNEFGIKKLAKVLLANSKLHANGIVKAVSTEVAAHTQSESHGDDQTVIALRVL